MFGISISLPSPSDALHALGDAAHTAENAAGSALHTTEDVGGAALSKAGQLARGGVDLGRQAVNAVSNINVQSIGATVSHAIGTAETAANKGIQTGVMTAGHAVQSVANDVNSHLQGSGVLPTLARGAVDSVANQTRFGLGAVGGVGQAAVGLVGSAGQLGVLGAEYQLSPSAHAAIDSKIADLATSGAKSLANYGASVAQDPGRVVGDLSNAASAGAGWVKGEVNSAQQAIKDGHGPESFGMQVGNAATYLIPVGGEARAVAGVGELATRGLGEDGVRALTEGGARTLTEDGAGTVARTSQAATSNVAASEVDAAAHAPTVTEPTGDAYSVAFQTELSPTSYPGLSRGAHFQEANNALLHAMERDPSFASGMKELGVNVERTPTGLAPRTSPTGWTWHHAPEPGVMQLVPRDQHAPGSIFQSVLHPDGRGGYAIWGK